MILTGYLGFVWKIKFINYIQKTVTVLRRLAVLSVLSAAARLVTSSWLFDYTAMEKATMRAKRLAVSSGI